MQRPPRGNSQRHGFNGLSIDYGTERQRPAIAPIDAKGVVGCLVKMIYKGVMNFSFDPAMDVLLDYVNEIMGGLSMNPDGSSMYNVGYERFPLSADHYEEVITDDRNETGIARACTETFARVIHIIFIMTGALIRGRLPMISTRRSTPPQRDRPR